jgi:hypothetical protein
MATLADHEKELRSGTVSEGGFAALIDAEIYGNVSSIGALEKHLRILQSTLVSGTPIEVNQPQKGKYRIKNTKEFQLWCQELFPSASI